MLTYSDLGPSSPQDPHTKEFSSCDLNWNKVKGRNRNIDNVAVIPYSRVEDFVKGEGNRVEFPTKFRLGARDKKKEDRANTERKGATLEYNTYYCEYGPDDHRDGGIKRPSREPTKPSEKKCPGRPLKKIGCQCRFVVKRFRDYRNVAFIMYNHREHVDKSGFRCHPITWFCKKKRTARGGELQKEN